MSEPDITPNRRGGSVALLIVGSIGAVVSMVLHPTPGHAGIDEHMAQVTAWVHGVAIASLWIQYAGMLAVHRRLRATPARADLGLVALGLGSLLATLAATVNGIGVPALVELRDAAEPGAREALSSSWRAMHRLGDVGTEVFFVGAAACAASWGTALRGSARVAGPLGVAVAAAALVGLVAGGLHAEVTPLLVFVAGFEAWVLALALWLRGDR